MFLPGYPCGPGGPVNDYINQTHVTNRSPAILVSYFCRCSEYIKHVKLATRQAHCLHVKPTNWTLGTSGSWWSSKKGFWKKKLAYNVTTKFYSG